MEKESIFLVVKDAIADVLPDVDTEAVSIEQNLKSLGANSIDRTEIVMSSMEKLGIKLPLVSFGGVENIEDMVDVMVDAYR
ncbi:MAG: acyl carrier protein [Gammaproteobacteria bacterium]|nr:acyl carrier protein [Gammaproteobacteria bacterium]MCF6259953.1 acyl carrier protein [Gammaproteobacteria bacterium]